VWLTVDMQAAEAARAGATGQGDKTATEAVGLQVVKARRRFWKSIKPYKTRLTQRQ